MKIFTSGSPRSSFNGQAGTQGASQGGFTLMEILVAVAIIAIVLGALVQAAGASAANAGRIRDKTVAQWVGSNRLAELQITGSFPDTGNKSGEAEMLGQIWYWKTIVQKVEDEDLRRVDIEVRKSAESKNPIVTIAGFVNHPRLSSRNVSQP